MLEHGVRHPGAWSKTSRAMEKDHLERKARSLEVFELGLCHVPISFPKCATFYSKLKGPALALWTPSPPP